VSQNSSEILKLKERISDLESAKTSITNVYNNIINNNTINIVINDHGEENWSYITPEIFKECLKEMNLGILVENLHFHSLHPENMNIRLRNIHKKIIEVRDDNTWKYSEKTLETLVSKYSYKLIRFFKDNKKEIRAELDEEYDGYRALQRFLEIEPWLNKLDANVEKECKEAEKVLFCILLKYKKKS
jgi:hypothetical protein